MAEDTFLDWLQQQSPGMLAPQDVAQFIQQAAAALQGIHEQRIVHGHITPVSFLIHQGSEQSRFPNLHLANFSAQDTVDAPASRAPEQWYGTTLPASDQYALAIMAYQLLTWRSPFQGNQDQLRFQHLSVQPEPPGRFNPLVSPALDSVIMRALAKRPEERYPNINTFANAFLQASQVSSTGAPLATPELASQAVAAPMSSSARTGRRELVSSMSREALLLTLIFLLVVSGIGFGFYAIVKHNQAAANGPTPSPAPGSTNEPNLSATLTSRTPFFADSLSSDDGHWDRSATCVFTGGTYHILLQQAGGLGLCGFVGSHYADVAIQVDVSLLAGDNTGLVFRFASSGNTEHFYFFNITKRGEFFFGKDSNGNFSPLIPITKTGAIMAAPQKNSLLVIAKGSDFKVYINRIFVGEAHDRDSSSGEIGFIAGTSDSDARGDASFANFKLYRV